MKKIVIGFMALAMVCTTGCAEVVDLTEEESTIIAQYAATATLKYDKNYNKNIVQVSKEEETEESEKEAVPEEMTEDTETAESESGTEEKINVADSLKLSNVNIEYIDAEVMSQYINEDNVTIETASGDAQLLVVKFLMKNELTENNFVEILSVSPKFILNVNGKKIKSLETMYENDLTTLCTTLEPNEEREQVLVFEVPLEDISMLEGISLNIESGYDVITLEWN